MRTYKSVTTIDEATDDEDDRSFHDCIMILRFERFSSSTQATLNFELNLRGRAGPRGDGFQVEKRGEQTRVNNPGIK